MKRIFMIAVLMLTAVLTAQNQTFTGTKTFRSPPKFKALVQNDANTKVLTVNGTDTVQWRDVGSLAGNIINNPTSATQTGVVNNVLLQELGGVDKLINSIRIGQGNKLNLESTCFGENSLSADLGGYNSAFGWETLKNNTSGLANDAFGGSALRENISGSYNTALGTGTLEKTSGGYGNCAIGGFSMYNLQGTGWSQSTVGCRNTAVGGSAMFSASTGSFNVAIGSESLKNLSTGSNNISIGANAAQGITSGSNNVYIGRGTLIGNTSDTILISTASTNRIIVDATGKTNLLNRLNVSQTQVFSDNDTAKANGLVLGDVYRTSTGLLMIVF